MTDRNELLDLRNDLEKSLGRADRLGLRLVSISICDAIDKISRELDQTVTADDKVMRDQPDLSVYGWEGQSMPGNERDSARQPNVLGDLAYSTYLTRRIRHEIFNPELFGEPAWDILLLLFSNTDHSGQLSVQEIAQELKLSERLVSRWIDVLVEHDLVLERSSGAELSMNGRERLKSYLKRQIGSLMQMLESVSTAEKQERGAA